MPVNTDGLLSKKFFSSLDSSPEIHKAFQDERSELTELIKIELYPSYKKIVYYLGKHLDRKVLDDFINSEDYKSLQGQLKVIIDRLKQWGEAYELEERSSLDDFLIKLQNPTEKMTLLYADGKRSLEIITVLLNNDQIPLELRKVAYIQLLADNELSKCIDGCYTRIVTSMQQLELYRQSPNKINRWIRAYTTQIAKDISAKRPFAMPESYQVLICRTLDISVATNELHASNYLLLKAKENEFPVDSINDISALEIKKKMYDVNRDKLVEFYLDDLAEAVTATGLVHYIATRLHDELGQIISDPEKNYSEKINVIETKLKQVGIDPDFLIGEILEDDPFSLKGVERLKITTERRLSQQGWLSSAQSEKLNIFNRIYTHYNFPGNIELNWFSVAGDTERYRFIDLIQDNIIEFSIELKSQILISLFRKPAYISNLKDLITLPEKNFLSFSLTRLIPTQRIITLLKKETNALLFVNLINRVDGEKGSQIIKALGIDHISEIIKEGYLESNVKHKFFWLQDSYFIQNYNEVATKEGLKVTQELLIQLVEKNFRNFNSFIFRRLKYLDYLKGINFFECDLERALFLQQVTACTFDQANLKYAQFDRWVAHSSFRKVDLRQTTFLPPPNSQNSKLSLETAIFSTKTLSQLINSGIRDFSEADLTQVDFHSVLTNKNMYLDFSRANLKYVQFNGIDLRSINFFSANLEYANLLDSYFNMEYLNKEISIQGAWISKYLAQMLSTVGVRQFDECKIIDQRADYYETTLKFASASFRGSSFIGYICDLEFKDCDFSGASFTATNELPVEEKTFILNIKFQNCQFDKTSFQNIKFLEPFKLQDSPLKNILLDNVEVSPSVLFKLYESGHRDFSRVKALKEKEKIPDRLPPFPLLDASLSKEMFIQLFKQGLRDFRLSNLSGFYLAKVLEEEAISEIELKLEGAHYQQSPLSCGSSRSNSPHNKRSIAICNVYFLIQKSSNKRTISWWDLQDLGIIILDKNTLLKEASLGVAPLYTLDNLDEPINLHLYWGYKPDREAFMQLSDFLEKSTQVTQRNFLKVNLYFDHLKTDDLQLLSQNIHNLGFTNGQLTYFDEKNRQMIRELNQKSSTETIQIDALSQLNNKIKPFEKPNLPNKEWRAQLKNRVNHLKMHALDQGVQYDAFLVLLNVIATWIGQSDAIEIKQLTIDEKIDLQNFMSEFVEQEVLNHSANEHQHDLTFNIALQCIERGECHNCELVRKNVLNTLQTLRPDLDIGFEELGKKIKSDFESIGSYFTSLFDDLLKRFSLLLYLDEAFHQANKNQKVKRKSINWYSQPKIVYFIKMIESAFNDLGFDLNLDPDYSESLLAGYLYDLWQALKKQGVSCQTSLNLTLNLLENPQFIQSTFHGTYLSQDKIYLDLNQNNITQVASIPIRSAIISPKTNRVVKNTKHSEGNKNSPTEQQERIRQIEDDYIIHYDWKSKGFKGINGRMGIKGSRRSREIKETNTLPTALIKAQKRIESKTHKDKPKQSVEKNISRKSDNLSMRNPRNQLISHGLAQFPITKHGSHQQFFGANHFQSKSISSKCSLRAAFVTKELGGTTKKSLPPSRRISFSPLPSDTFHTPGKRSIAKATAIPNTLATLTFLNLFTKKTNQRKPIASLQKLTRYRKASRSINKKEDPFGYHLSLR